MHSHATGKVSANFDTLELGGLVGSAFGPIADSYATGAMTWPGGGYLTVGGLVGETASSITRSFATGSMRRNEYPHIDAGLVGVVGNGSSVTNSYSTGATSGGFNTASGGLIGVAGTSASISSTYATGKITDGGGFACGIYPSEVSNGYWDTTSSGTTYGVCGNHNISGITGLTTTQLQSGLPAGFDPKIWAQDRKINRGFPYLIANPPPQ
jgi:hypothetical protein